MTCNSSEFVLFWKLHAEWTSVTQEIGLYVIAVFCFALVASCLPCSLISAMH